ncbi:MAG: hypothetical protein ACK4EX_07020 [Thermaurantimonas sp.]|uniref:hypothetical protein n=1 Tax=Thermaurantimonas sp. TaxID=2681568 RepID=UPI00391C01F8
MKRVFIAVALLVMISCGKKTHQNFSNEDLEKIYFLDTLENQIISAQKIANEYNPERMKTILQELEPYYKHFKNSKRQYSREFFIYELSGLEDTRRSLSKSLPEYQKIKDEIDFNLQQVRALRKLINESDSLTDSLKIYIDQEAIAMQETMTKFYKRIRNPLTYKDRWPVLKAKLDSAMQYDLQSAANE